MAEYNGWHNWETWLTALHIDNDEVAQEMALELARSSSSDYEAGEAIVNYVQESADDAVSAGPFVADILDGFFSSVNKREIGAHYRQDEGLTGPRKRSARKRTTRKRTTRKRRTTCGPRKRTTRKRTARKRTTRRRR